MHRRLIPVLKAATTIAAALLAAAVVVASRGTIDIVKADPRAAALAAVPAWADPCKRREPRHDRELLHGCARVSGRVVAVRREVIRTGPPEIHLAVIADFHLFVLKLEPGARRPSLGSTVTAVGSVVRASNGLREVDAVQVTPA